MDVQQIEIYSPGGKNVQGTITTAGTKFRKNESEVVLIVDIVKQHCSCNEFHGATFVELTSLIGEKEVYLINSERFADAFRKMFRTIHGRNTIYSDKGIARYVRKYAQLWIPPRLVRLVI